MTQAKSIWQPLQPGDTIDLIAPSSTPDVRSIPYIIKMIESAGFKASTKYAPINDELGYANTIQIRAESFYKAMCNENSKMVWAIRGGAGSTRLWPYLSAQATPPTPKPVVGFSDITGLHSFVNFKWNCPSVHGVVAEYNKEMAALFTSTVNKDQSIQSVMNIVTGKVKNISYDVKAINNAAHCLQAVQNVPVFGGNSTLVETSLGSPFRVNGKDSILIIESIGATVHQLERMFDGYAWGFSMLTNTPSVKAIIIGETLLSETHKNDPENQAEFDKAIKRLGDLTPNVPVFSAPIFGHGNMNQPLILGTSANLTKKDSTHATLTVSNPAFQD